MNLKLLFLVLFAPASLYSVAAPYTITNRTNYPAKVEVTFICEYDTGLQEQTIQLDFAPREAKNIPGSCRLMSVNALVNVDGKDVSTGAFSGNFYTGKSSGSMPSWEIYASTEGGGGNYTGMQPYIRMVP